MVFDPAYRESGMRWAAKGNSTVFALPARGGLMWKDLNHFVIEVIAFGSFAVSIGSLLIEEMLGKVARRRGTCYF